MNISCGNKEPLRVADLFCGPGGLSEGFRLAGFEIVYGLDKSRDAVETFRINHPGAVAVVGDAVDLDADSIPEFDVLIGGPPCVNFSNSKGGRANVLEGLRLVQAFLRVVHLRQPRYWVMENVPRVARHLPERIPLSWIGVEDDGFLDIPVRNEFATADFGIPQKRNRFLIGKYPVPRATREPGKEEVSPSLGDVLAAFPSPHRPAGKGPVTDINYGFAVPGAELADHRHPVALNPAEVDRIREVKTCHPYMGKMAFPDRLDRPARTVVATQLGRETLVVADDDPSSSGFRRLSVRECATLQTFPITYRFAGRTLASRYRQAGDAVPPMFSHAIARSILAAEQRAVPEHPILAEGRALPEAAVPGARRAPEKLVLPWTKRFARLVPGKEVRGCRVEFGNLFPGAGDGVEEDVRWQAILHVGELKGNLRAEVIHLDSALWELAGLECWGGRPERERILGFVRDLDGAFRHLTRDGKGLQRVYTRREKGTGPRELTDKMGRIIDAWFPAVTFGKRRIARSGKIGVVPSSGLLVRLAAGAVAAAHVAERVSGQGEIAERLWSRARRVLGERRAQGAEGELLLAVS